jgi:hypothetical protein
MASICPRQLVPFSLALKWVRETGECEDGLKQLRMQWVRGFQWPQGCRDSVNRG